MTTSSSRGSRHITSIIASATLALSLLVAAPTYANGCVGFAGGTGTSGDPYQVADRAGLEALGQCTAAGTHFLQTAHIDLGGSGSPWTPLGASVGFAGDFDGDSYQIKNLHVNVSGLAGLFAKLSGATLSNLRLVDADVTSTTNDAGIIAGFATNTVIEDSSVAGAVKGKGTTGGFIGMTQSPRSFLSRVSAGAAVESEISNAGGIVGQVEFSSATLTDVLATGTVNSVAGFSSGGILGYGIAPTINRAVSLASVTGATSRGGVIGSMVNTSVLTNSFFLDSAVTQLSSNFAVAKSAAELQSLATFSGATFSIGGTADAATTWRLVAEANNGFPYLAGTSFNQPEPVAAVAPPSYDGPVFEVSNRLVRPGDTLTLTGARLDSVTSVRVGGLAVEVRVVGSNHIELTLPAALAAGSHDLVVLSSFGTLTVQGALVVAAQATKASPRVVIRPMSDSTVKLYVFDLVGAGKFTIEVAGRQLAWVNANDAEDSKLRVSAEGVPYLVRTLSAEQAYGLDLRLNGLALGLPQLSR